MPHSKGFVVNIEAKSQLFFKGEIGRFKTDESLEHESQSLS